MAESAPGENAFDGDPTTYWHTQYFARTNDPIDALPHHITIDLGHNFDLTGFRYRPPQGGAKQAGHIGSFTFEVSTNGTDFTEIHAGTFPEILGTTVSPEALIVFTETAENVQYIRLTATSDQGNRGLTSIAEINLLDTSTP